MRKVSPLYEKGIEVLKSSALFGELSDDELDTILKSGRYEVYKKSEAIENGEGVEYLNIIIEGAVKLSQIDPSATRLAKLILKHTSGQKSENNHFPVELINRLSHETIAEMIGSVRSVVTSQLGKMREEGLILSRRGKLLVKELELLKERYGL